MLNITRRKFFFGGAVAAVVAPVLALRPERGDAPPMLVRQGNMAKSDLYIGNWGGATWFDDEYDERLAEVTENVLHRRFKLEDTAFAPKT